MAILHVCWRHSGVHFCLLSNYYIKNIFSFLQNAPITKKRSPMSPYWAMASNKANSKLMINYCHIQTTLWCTLALLSVDWFLSFVLSNSFVIVVSSLSLSRRRCRSCIFAILRIYNKSEKFHFFALRKNNWKFFWEFFLINLINFLSRIFFIVDFSFTIWLF